MWFSFILFHASKRYPEHATSTKILPLLETQCKHYTLEKTGHTTWRLTLGSKATFVKQLVFDSSTFKNYNGKIETPIVLSSNM